MNVQDILKYGHLSLLGTLEGLPEEERETPGVCGVWSVKDILAHLASYELALVDLLGAFVRGEDEMGPTLRAFVEEHNSFNDAQVMQRRTHSTAAVLAEYVQAHEQVTALAAQLNPALWPQAGTLPWYGAEYSLADFIVYTYYGHKREHGAQIAAFRDRSTPAVLALVQQFNEALNRHDTDAMMALMTPDCVYENTLPPPDGKRYEGQAAVRAFWQEFFAASPHAAIELEELVAAGDRCTARWMYRWKEADGRGGYVRGVDVFRVRDGRIAEKLSYVKG